MSLFDLNGKVALVTGASSGIGQRQVQALAEAGANVVLLGRRQAQLDTTVVELESLGASAAALAVDLDNREQLSEVATQAALPFGHIDILINAAGVNLRQTADDISLESWDQTLNLNLAVPFFLARELLPAMRTRGWGRIINIASLQSSRAFANGLAYGASKGGIAQLTRAMAEAWSADGINCNAIAPGFFPTGLTAPLYQDPEMLDRLARQTAIGRNGDLADLDGITVFLASAASNYITGQIIHLDGGFTAK
ncbi:MAG: SDR family oxidoreductase [Gammaproteobacteria bacterium]|nr:SDR family oxidoreductase [Gammaproteobacteria bacterium]